MPTQNMNSYFQQGAPNPGGTGNPGGVYNTRGGGFGYGGGMYADQNPNLGRYRPPMMSDGGNPNSWMDYGGYAYNSPNSYGRPYGGYGFRPNPQNDVYMHQPRGTGRGGGGFGYGYQQNQSSDPYLGDPNNWNGRQFRGKDEGRSMYPGASGYGDVGRAQNDQLEQWRALTTGSGQGAQNQMNSYLGSMMQGDSYGDMSAGRGGFGYGYGGKHPYGTDPGAAAYGDEGLRRFQAQQQAQMMDPMAQWRALMTGSGSGGNVRQVADYFAAYMANPDQTQSYGGDARRPVAYGGGPTKGGYAKPLAQAEPMQYSGTGDFDWGARRINRRFRRY